MFETEDLKELWPETCQGGWMDVQYEEGLVSVIIPTYNRAHFITDAIESVWDQTYRPIELIVVDDGSTDNTSEVAKEWAKKTGGDDQFQFRYLRQENKGAPAARNLGCIASRGEFIQFLDSDDWLYPEKLTLQVSVLERYAVERVVSEYHVADKRARAQRSAQRPIEPKLRDSSDYLSWTCYPSQSAQGLQIRRLCRRMGPWAGMALGQDTEYFLRQYLDDVELAELPLELFYYHCGDHKRVHVTLRDPEKAEQRMSYPLQLARTLKASGRASVLDFDQLSKLFCAEARMAFGCGARLVARRLLRESIRYARFPLTFLKIGYTWLAFGLVSAATPPTDHTLRVLLRI